jgi:hypothetical protein
LFSGNFFDPHALGDGEKWLADQERRVNEFVEEAKKEEKEAEAENVRQEVAEAARRKKELAAAAPKRKLVGSVLAAPTRSAQFLAAPAKACAVRTPSPAPVSRVSLDPPAQRPAQRRKSFSGFASF